MATLQTISSLSPDEFNELETEVRNLLINTETFASLTDEEKADIVGPHFLAQPSSFRFTFGDRKVLKTASGICKRLFAHHTLTEV